MIRVQDHLPNFESKSNNSRSWKLLSSNVSRLGMANFNPKSYFLQSLGLILKTFFTCAIVLPTQVFALEWVQNNSGNSDISGTIIADSTVPKYGDLIAVYSKTGGIILYSREYVGEEKIDGETPSRSQKNFCGHTSSFGIQNICGSVTSDSTSEEISEDDVSGFEEEEFVVGETFTYGTWYVATQVTTSGPENARVYSIKVLFRPNTTNINKLSTRDEITSTLTFNEYRGSSSNRERPSSRSITVTIHGPISNDPPAITAPSGDSCHEVAKPEAVNTPNTQAFWVEPFPDIYMESNATFNPRMGFRNPTNQQSQSPTPTKFNVGSYFSNGMPENEDIGETPTANMNYHDFSLKSPRDYTGYLRYKILPRETADAEWYSIGTPCEFEIWWVDASRPGITLTVEQATVAEGTKIKIKATAFPTANRNIVVPITLSDQSRIETPESLEIVIEDGESEGTLELQTIYQDGDQSVDDITVSARWNSLYKYALVDSKRTDMFTITDHVNNIIRFKNANPNIEAGESETVELEVIANNAPMRNALVKYRLIGNEVAGNTATKGVDFVDPTTKQITIVAGSREGKISIALIDDALFEEPETFTVELIDNEFFTADATKAIVTINSDDAPMIVRPSTSCAVPQSTSGVTPVTLAYWRMGAPLENEVPVVYRELGDTFNVLIGFRDPITGINEGLETANTFDYATYYISGMIENPRTSIGAQVLAGGVRNTINNPRDFPGGYLSYRIIPKATEDNTWYSVGAPCEFHLWWTSADRPGITLSIDENNVMENGTFTLRATATPALAANKSISVPITFANPSLVKNSENLSIDIAGGDSSGTLTVNAGEVPSGQISAIVKATATWSDNYWLDHSDAVKSASVNLSKVPSLSFSMNSYSVVEPEGETANATITVNIDPPLSAGKSVDVYYETMEIADADTQFDEDPAKSGVDFTGTESTTESDKITFAANDSKKIINIPILEDNNKERNEVFRVKLLKPELVNGESIAILGNDENEISTVVTILDDPAEVVPVLLLNNDTIDEDVGTYNLPVKLSGTTFGTVTIDYQLLTTGNATKGTDATNGDFMLPGNSDTGSVMIDAGTIESALPITIFDDTLPEGLETITIKFNNPTFAVLPDDATTKEITLTINQSDRVPTIGDDIPEPISPFSHTCNEISKPQEVGVPNTEAYWKSTPATLSEPRAYIATDESFDVKIGFRNPGTGAESPPNIDTDFLIGTYVLGGTAHADSIRVRGISTRNDATHRISQPGRLGYFRYRLLPRGARPPASWYSVGTPCEFHVWWVDAGRPGISISIEETTIHELETFTVKATATPPPNRDLRIPISFSNTSLLQNAENRFIEIQEGKESGTLTVSAAALPSGQVSENITVTVPWHTEEYYLDGSQNSASASIQKIPTFVEFADDSLEKTVTESAGKVDLTVRLTKPAANDVVISLSLDEGATATVGSDFNVTSYIVRIAKGQVTQSISIPILEDQVASEPKEHFDLTLAQVSGGVLLGTNNTARVYIVESTDPVVPKADLSISIAPIASEISAGVDAEFSVYMNNAPENDFTVPLTVSQEGDVIGLTAPRDVLVKATKTSAVVSIATNRNGSGSVTVSLNHRRSNPNEDSATVTVVPGNSNNEPLISVVSSVIESILLNIPHTQENTEAPLKPAIPVLEINPVRTEVTEGEVVEFVVSTDSMGTVAERLEVSVELTEQGDFIADESMRTAVLEPRQNSKSVYVATVDDDYAEYDGLITASIEAGTGYEVSLKSSATVRVTDAGDREIRKQLVHGKVSEILPSMTASLGDRSLSATSLRMTQAFNQSSSSTVQFGGQSSIQELLKLGGRTANEGKIDWREALGDSSATINLFPEQNGSNYATIWAMGNRNSYSDKAGSQNQSWNGEELAGHFGFDTKVNRTLFGFATTLSEANATHAGGVTDDELGFNSNTVGVQPYVGYQSVNGDFQLHSSAGYGTGEIGIDQESYNTLTFDSAIQLATLGAQQRLYSSDNFFGGTGSFDLSSESWIARQYLTSDESYIGDFSTAVRYLRVEGEGSRSQQFANGQSFSQQASIGLVERSIDQLSSIELEFAGTGGYRDPIGLDVSITGRASADDSNQVRQWQLMGDLSLDFAEDRQGILFDVSPAWTWYQDHADIQFWRTSRGLSSFDYTGTPAGLQINSRIGYGNSAFDDTSLITPFTSLDFSQDGKKVFQFGSEISVGANFRLESGSSFDFRQDEFAGAEFHVKSRLNW